MCVPFFVQPIAILVEEGADIAAFENFSAQDAGGDSAAAPAPKKDDKKASPADEPNAEAASGSDPAPAPTPAPEPEDTGSSGKLQPALDREANISASAKRLAADKGINISTIKGTGSGGKITEDDVKKAATAPATASVAPGSSYEDVPVSSMRKTIAGRLLESTQKNPHFFVTSSLSVTKLLKLRQALNSASDAKFKISVNDFLIKAVAVASRRVPAVNASWRDNAIRQFKTVDVSVAVSTPTGLITPIVTGVEGRGLESISSRVKELAAKAREGKLKPEEFQGGSISISNMGMNAAVDHFTAVINPPQAAILAVGTTKKVAIPAAHDPAAVEWDDQITVTASFDHKVVDGAVGGEWIRELKKVIENPIELLL